MPLIALLMASIALAGCAAPADEEVPTPTATTTPDATPTVEPTPTPITPPTVEPTPVTPTPPAETLGNETYTITTSGVPTMAKTNQSFNFTMSVNGSLSFASDHVGAHYANNTTAAPVAAAMGACQHANGTLPGTFNVTCTLAQPGTWHVYGHARAIVDNATYHYWAAPFAVMVRDLNLTLTAPTTPQTSGSAFDVTLNVTGVENFTSDHVGVHFWNATTAEPTTANAAGACVHVTTGVVGVHKVSCTLTNSGLTVGEFFLRGHVRATEGASVLHWWSSEVKVSVLPGF